MYLELVINQVEYLYLSPGEYESGTLLQNNKSESQILQLLELNLIWQCFFSLVTDVFPNIFFQQLGVA